MMASLYGQGWPVIQPSSSPAEECYILFKISFGPMPPIWSYLHPS